jgi:hypothetical protein
MFRVPKDYSLINSELRVSVRLFIKFTHTLTDCPEGLHCYGAQIASAAEMLAPFFS